jgi:hypothetical protein
MKVVSDENISGKIQETTVTKRKGGRANENNL